MWQSVLLVFAVLAPVAGATAQDPSRRFIAQTPPRSPAEQRTLFHLPPGFRIELVAAEPEVPKPINLAFDAAGRLFVTTSLEYPFPASGDRPPRDAIKVLADTDGDGVPDRVSTFAGKLNIPIGVVPVHDAVLGYSIPHLYRFADTDGDGRADERMPAYSRFGYDDTHGMCSSLEWWIDGWVYGCHGFRNNSTVRGEVGRSVTMNSGNTYRLLPDGSHIEQFTHGQVNPFGLCFDPRGDVYTADCHSRPAYLLLRGAYYPSFGKPHDGLGYGPELMRHAHGSTGIAGVVYYAADQFPPKYRDTLFIGNPVTGRINHDRLERRGSTWRAIEQPDFLRCDDPWFRPVDVQLAPDGSLYVADFYNRIIGHYEVPLDHPLRDRSRGRIWRVVYAGDKPTGSPEAPSVLTRLSAEELFDRLADPNLTVRVHATHQLVERVGASAADLVIKRLDGKTTAEQRAHAVWVLARLGRLKPPLIARFADDADALVRLHLIRSLAERDTWDEALRNIVLSALNDNDAFVRRAAADALGRHPHAATIEPLLSLWQRTPAEDALLIHTTRMAIRNIVHDLDSLPKLAEEYAANSRRLAQLADISPGIPAEDSARFLLSYYKERDIPAAKLAGVLEHIGRHAAPAELPQLYDLSTRLRSRDERLQQAALLALKQAADERGETLPETIRKQWATPLAEKLLNAPQRDAVRRGVELARVLKLSAETKLAKLAAADSPHPPLRRPALEALLATKDRRQSARLLDRVVGDLTMPMAERQWAAVKLGGLRSAESRRMLVERFKTAPRELALGLARGLAVSREGAAALLAAVEKGLASPRLLTDARVRGLLEGSGLPEVEQRLERLLGDLPPQDEQLAQLIAGHRSGFERHQPDASAGAKHFAEHCAACHSIGETGRKVGPELDGIGLRGAERLLEDLLDPGRNVDAAFRASVVALKDGRVLTGLVRRQEGRVLLLVDTEGNEQRIPLAEIEQRRELRISPMPANVTEKLKPAELYDLLAYLLEQRRQSEPAGRAGE